MKIAFMAGFGPIVRDMHASTRFYTDALGIAFEGDESYRHTDKLDGVRTFSLWPLSEAAKSCFGTDEWPSDLHVPQAWVEFDVDSADAVTAAAEELAAGGHRLLAPPKTEEWGQTVVHLLSPEGLLLGVSYTPWMH
ncbi:MAG: VOC family protein [Candidatus Limnocylindria bacterium]